VRNRTGAVDEVKRSKNRNKSKIRARVEHVFGVVKRLGLQKGALSRTAEERDAHVRRAGLEQPLHVPKAAHGTGASVRAQCGSKDSQMRPDESQKLALRLEIPHSELVASGIRENSDYFSVAPGSLFLDADGVDVTRGGD
jgi:hypothetical protein